MNLPALHGNWIDLVILVVLGYFAYESWGRGLWLIVADFLSFFLALVVSLKAYKLVANLLIANFSLTKSLANAVGFLVTALALEMLFGYLLVWLLAKLTKASPVIRKLWKSKWNKFFGLVLGLGEGVIFVAFVLTFIISLPVSPEIKNDISASKIGSYLIKQTSGLEKNLNDVFGGLVNDSILYQTVEPGNKQTIPLQIASQNLVVDEKAEGEMFAATNNERTSRGIPALTWSPQIVAVARAYARDMWVRQYFSHYSPEGQDVGGRLTAAGIGYTFAGENLALAPTTAIAETGLMNSPGHKANILDTNFHKVGIGVISNGYYGLMIVEDFTN